MNHPYKLNMRIKNCEEKYIKHIKLLKKINVRLIIFFLIRKFHVMDIVINLYRCEANFKNINLPAELKDCKSYDSSSLLENRHNIHLLSDMETETIMIHLVTTYNVYELYEVLRAYELKKIQGDLE